MCSKGILLVSIESKIVNTDYINYVINKVEKKVSSLSLLILDELEKINYFAFWNYSKDKIQWLIDLRSKEIIADLRRNSTVEIMQLKWNEFLSKFEARDYILKVKETYKNNSKFKNHCLNQTFKNLQPILAKKGIFKKNHLILENLVEYLLNEIGIKLFYNHKKIFDVEIIPSQEMEVIEAIYNNKYSEFKELIKNRTELLLIKPEKKTNELTLEGISFNYSDREEEFKIKNLNMKIPSGGIFGILGKNASGKSTILNIIGGHLSPKKGKIFIGNTDITKLTPKERPISTVFQELSLFPHLNSLENVKFGLQAQTNYSKDLINDIALRQLIDFDFAKYEKKYPRELSIGLQQKLSIARALVVNPTILLLDEPTLSLDFNEQNNLINTLKWLSERFNCTNIIIVSHNKDFIFTLCENLCILEKGRVIGIGKTKSMYFNPSNTLIAKILESGNIIEGILDNNMHFISKTEEIDIAFDNQHSYLKNQKCAILIRQDAFVFDNEKDTNSISLSARLVNINFKTLTNELTLCSPKGQHIKIEIPHSKAQINYFNKNKKFSIKFFIKDIKLIPIN